MKKREVDHVLRAAGRITGEKQFIIIGSQALHGKYPDLPDQILRSFEVDLLSASKAARADWLNSIGIYSAFHESYGYYVDPVDDSTATLPEDWKNRLVNLPQGDTEGVKGLCLEPHDLAIAKYVASREKDLVFTGELVKRGLLIKDRLFSLLEQTPIDDATRTRIQVQIERDFAAEKRLETERTQGRPLDKHATPRLPDARSELEAIRARGRQNWLEMRQKAARDVSERADASQKVERHKDAASGIAADGADESVE
jgi:hypothetical protein